MFDKMKILLVYCNSMLENALPISITQLSSCLKENGFTVGLFDTTFYKWGPISSMENRIEALQIKSCEIRYNKEDIYEDFIKKIDSFQPDLIGFSVVEPTLNLGFNLLNHAKTNIILNNIKIAFGGVHCILAPETLESNDLIDFICIGEGEYSFIELCTKLQQGKNINDVKGFWIKENGTWIKNQKAQLVDLNKQPILDFDIFDESYLLKPMMGKDYKTISIEVSRGCPYNCTYCGDTALKDIFKSQGKWYRYKSLEKISEELEHYVSKYTPEFIYIISESFLAQSMERFKKFAEVYKRYSLPFWCNSRPEDINEEKVKILKEINCKRISIGIESGSEVFRKKFLRRKTTNKQIMEMARIFHKYDISFSVNLMIGFPDETREMIFEGIDLCKQINPDGISTHIYNPYHGTELRDVCIKKGYISPDLIADDFFQGYQLINNNLSANEIMGLFRTIPLYVALDKGIYDEIKIAEKFDDIGNNKFVELKQLFYKVKNW